MNPTLFHIFILNSVKKSQIYTPDFSFENTSREVAWFAPTVIWIKSFLMHHPPYEPNQLTKYGQNWPWSFLQLSFLLGLLRSGVQWRLPRASVSNCTSPNSLTSPGKPFLRKSPRRHLGVFFDAHQSGVRLNFDVDVKILLSTSTRQSFDRRHLCENGWRVSAKMAHVFGSNCGFCGPFVVLGLKWCPRSQKGVDRFSHFQRKKVHQRHVWDTRLDSFLAGNVVWHVEWFVPFCTEGHYSASALSQVRLHSEVWGKSTTLPFTMKCTQTCLGSCNKGQMWGNISNSAHGSLCCCCCWHHVDHCSLSVQKEMSVKYPQHVRKHFQPERNRASYEDVSTSGEWIACTNHDQFVSCVLTELC